MCYSLSWSEKKLMTNFKNNNKKECGYCGKKLTDAGTTIDHKNPHSRAGATIESNLILSCKECNTEKSDMNQEEYTDYLKLKEITFNNNIILKELNNLILTYKNIINIYLKNSEEISKLYKDRNEIEKIMRDDTYNASQGFCLCRDMRDTLKSLQEKQKVQSNSIRSYDFSRNNMKNVLEEKANLEKVIMNSIRTKYNIGQISSLGIEKIEFEF